MCLTPVHRSVTRSQLSLRGMSGEGNKKKRRMDLFIVPEPLSSIGTLLAIGTSIGLDEQASGRVIYPQVRRTCSYRGGPNSVSKNHISFRC